MFNHLFTQDSFQSEGERRRKVLSIRQNTHLQSASTTVAPRDNIIDGRIRDGKGSRDIPSGHGNLSIRERWVWQQSRQDRLANSFSVAEKRKEEREREGERMQTCSG